MNETEYMAHVALVDMATQADPNFQPVSQFEARLHRWAQRKGQYKWWQFTLLLAGAAFFIIWHVLEMLLRTADQPVFALLPWWSCRVSRVFSNVRPDQSLPRL
jgi:hypothetical protein